jgi:hypothetical protein
MEQQSNDTAQAMATKILQHLSSKRETESFEEFENRVIESLRKKGLLKDEPTENSQSPTTPNSESSNL